MKGKRLSISRRRAKSVSPVFAENSITGPTSDWAQAYPFLLVQIPAFHLKMGKTQLSKRIQRPNPASKCGNKIGYSWRGTAICWTNSNECRKLDMDFLDVDCMKLYLFQFCGSSSIHNQFSSEKSGRKWKGVFVFYHPHFLSGVLNPSSVQWQDSKALLWTVAEHCTDSVSQNILTTDKQHGRDEIPHGSSLSSEHRKTAKVRSCSQITQRENRSRHRVCKR